MTVWITALDVDALLPRKLADFWSRVLSREVDPGGVSLPAGSEPGFAIRFVQVNTPKTTLHRMHFDLTSPSGEDQQRSVELALSLGARHLDVGQRGDEGHVVLADPEDNEFCVIEPGNRFLAQTARIGALAGDGLREVGYFWSRALRWPLVWDRDGETAVQHPEGGTKITWGGPPVAAKHVRNRLRWALETDQPLDAEVERLVRLGATILNTSPSRVELADSDGNEFTLTRIRS